MGVLFRKIAAEQVIIWRMYIHLYMLKPVKHEGASAGRLSCPNAAFKPEDSEVTSVFIRASAVLD